MVSAARRWCRCALAKRWAGSWRESVLGGEGSSMKVCVYGAGAIGGNLAVRLLLGGEAVSVVTRGEHLRAIRERGLILHADGKVLNARPAAATDDPSTLPPQDCVIVTLKAHSTAQAAAAIARLLAPNGFAIFALNG